MNESSNSQTGLLSRPSLCAASAFVLLATAGLWLSSLAAGLFSAGPEAMWAIENALYYLPFVALPMALYARRHRGLSGAMRLNPLPVMSVLTLGLLGLLSVYIASAMAAVWGALLDGIGLHSPAGVAVPGDERALALSILTMAALPAVCEELLFRGFVLAAWETRGTYFAIGVSSALFALLHGNLYGLPVYLLVGGIAGFVTFATGSVYAGMVYHTVYNAACLVIPYLMGQGQGDGAELFLDAARVISLAQQTLMMLGLTGVALATLWLRGRNQPDIGALPRARTPLEAGERLWLAAAVLAMIGTSAILLVLSGGGAA